MSDFIPRTRIMLIVEEGKRFKPYRCTEGKLTIGIGRNLEDVGISDTTAEQMFAEDVTGCLLHLHRVFGLAQFNAFSENRRLALVNLRFDLGPTRFLGFRKMIACVIAGDWEGAAAEVKDSRFNSQLPERSERIQRMLREDVFPY